MRKDDVGGGPIGPKQREVPLEHRAVTRLRAAIAHRDDRDLVDRRLFREREGDAGRQREHIGGAGRTLAFEALVALDAAVSGIAGVAFLIGDLDAVDAAIALVDQVVVVGDTVGERNAVRRIGAGPVYQAGDELLVLRQGRGGHHCNAGQRPQSSYGDFCTHQRSSIDMPTASVGRWSAELTRRMSPIVPANCRGLNTGTAIAEASPWRSPRAGPARAAPR